MGILAGRIELDGLDLYDTYGVFAVRGSLNDLVKMPDLKEPSLYSWPTEHGDDVDLDDRKVAARDITLTLLLSAADTQLMFEKRDLLFDALRADGIRTFDINIFSRTFKMWYKGCDSAKFINAGKKRIEMVLKFRLEVTETSDSTES